ncbi:MAG: response regulator, partial [Acidobacteria bacterium]
SRSLTAELSPPILHEGGLIPGLEWLARWMADKHGMFVDLETQPDASPAAEDVKALLFESARELLFNAVKHSGAKSVSVSLRRLKDDLVHLVVSDTGRGFDPKALKLAGISGGGFGLFSIRERLELIGGRIQIDSAPGAGSRFAITAPMGKPAVSDSHALLAETLDSPPVQIVSPSDGKIRVMLADDHEVMRQGLALLLAAEPDVEIVGEAADGFAAVELAGTLQPDVILMDLSMPRLNGVEATQAIHNDFPDICIIGLSMFEEAERAQAMRNAGAVDYLIKSGPAVELIAAIRTSVNMRHASPETDRLT